MSSGIVSPKKLLYGGKSKGLKNGHKLKKWWVLLSQYVFI